MVLPEWRRQLRRAGYQVQTQQIELKPTTDLSSLEIPAAFIYVVDSHGPNWATEGLATAIRLHYPAARMIVVGQDFNEVNSFPLFYLGVRGLVRYAAIQKQLGRALQFVARGGFWAPRDLVAGFVDSLLSSGRARLTARESRKLSQREREVLQCLLKNLSNKEISSQLHISESTVKFHVSNILAKYGVQRRADLILRSFQESSAA